MSRSTIFETAIKPLCLAVAAAVCALLYVALCIVVDASARLLAAVSRRFAFFAPAPAGVTGASSVAVATRGGLAPGAAPRIKNRISHPSRIDWSSEAIDLLPAGSTSEEMELLLRLGQQAREDVFSQGFDSAAHVWKGRVALYAVLRALGIGQGDSVLVPGYTCVVVPSAVQFVGAVPCYIDIPSDEYNVTPETVREALSRARDEGHRPRALVIQHTYGIPADARALLQLAAEEDMFLIEDCCHAIGSQCDFAAEPGRSDWRFAGTFGDASFYSSQWSKPVVSGLGGWAVATNDRLRHSLQGVVGRFDKPSAKDVSKLALQIAAYKTFFRPAFYWWIVDAYRMLSRTGLLVGSSGADEAKGEMPPEYCRRMSALQARIIARHLDAVGTYIGHQERLRLLYDQALLAYGIPPLVDKPGYRSVLLRYPLRMSDKPRILEEARKAHVELGDWFNHPLHPIGWNLKDLQWKEGLCPNAERAAREVINLPMHARIGERQVEHVVKFLHRLQTAGTAIIVPATNP